MNRYRPTTRPALWATAFLFLFGILAAQDNAKKKVRDGHVFGSQTPATGGLRGTVYRLLKETSWLPDFKHLRPVGTVYTTTLNYSMQPYEDEWFAIDYEGTFYITKTGKYRFLLTSDDGAQLFIDGKRIINNDGIHAAETRQEDIALEDGSHRLRVPYFQGPQPYIALVLEIQPPGGKKRIFDTDEFRAPPRALTPDRQPDPKRE